MTAMTAP